MVGDALGVVTGRGGDHTARRFGGLREALQLEARAAVLEGARVLQVLELEVEPQPEHVAEAGGGDGGGADDVGLDRGGGGANVVGGYLHGGGGSLAAKVRVLAAELAPGSAVA